MSRISPSFRRAVILVSLALVPACGPSRGKINEIIDRAQPLIDAITRYEKDKGHPPPALNDLVPQYIAAIPTTGFDSYPDYLYSVDMKSGRWGVSVKLGAIGFRHIAYSPSRDYSITVTPLRNGWILADP